MAGSIKTLLKALAGIRWKELYTLGLVVLGVPGIVWLWTNWKAALTMFVVVNIVLGFVSLRGAES